MCAYGWLVRPTAGSTELHACVSLLLSAIIRASHGQDMLPCRFLLLVIPKHTVHVDCMHMGVSMVHVCVLLFLLWVHAAWL